MSPRDVNPTVGMRHTGDSRSCWFLYVSRLPYDSDVTYELQVRHQHPADEFKFVACDMGDETELLTQADYEERVAAILEHEGHGPCAVEGCADPDGAAYTVRGRRTVGPDSLPVPGLCQAHAAQAEAADCELRRLDHDDMTERAAALLRQQRVQAAAPFELELKAALRARWDAFALLFRPAVTL